MPSSLMSGCAEAFMLADSLTTERSQERSGTLTLTQSNPFELIPRRHVGEDHLIALGEAADDLNRIDGALPELHLRARGFPSRRIDLEQADRALLLPERRAADIQDIVE